MAKLKDASLLRISWYNDALKESAYKGKQFEGGCVSFFEANSDDIREGFAGRYEQGISIEGPGAHRSSRRHIVIN
jgi:hypothetical protein